MGGTFFLRLGRVAEIAHCNTGRVPHFSVPLGFALLNCLRRSPLPRMRVISSFHPQCESHRSVYLEIFFYMSATNRALCVVLSQSKRNSLCEKKKSALLRFLIF